MHELYIRPHTTMQSYKRSLWQPGINMLRMALCRHW